MHSALLVDEIIRLIFEAVLKDSKSALCIAARSCQAWKDPALDCIWRRLPSAVPLLSLLPGFSMENDNILLGSTKNVSSTFRSYSNRVKHIIHRHRVIADASGIPIHLLHWLNNLESVRIETRAIGEDVLRMSLSPRLRSVVLQVGYTKSGPTSTTLHDMVSLLQNSSLEKLSIRGHSPECLHVSLGNVATLRSLSLHLSSLTEQSFLTVSTFPSLIDFEVHANRLSLDLFSAAIACTPGESFFPALEKLKIRAQPALVALLIQQLPRNKLCSLHVDTAGFSPSAFEGLFQAMAALPLYEFTLEHTILDDDSGDIPIQSLDKFFNLDHFRPLSKLPLRRFILDSSLPPDLSDSLIEEMTKWWPLLDRLELGASTALENVDPAWKPRSSLASLAVLARGCRYLEHLVITLDVDSTSVLSDTAPVPSPHHPLASLSISSRSRPDVQSLPTMLGRLFPSLVDVMPGYVGEHEEAWAAVQAAAP